MRRLIALAIAGAVLVHAAGAEEDPFAAVPNGKELREIADRLKVLNGLHLEEANRVMAALRAKSAHAKKRAELQKVQDELREAETSLSAVLRKLEQARAAYVRRVKEGAAPGDPQLRKLDEKIADLMEEAIELRLPVGNAESELFMLEIGASTAQGVERKRRRELEETEKRVEQEEAWFRGVGPAKVAAARMVPKLPPEMAVLWNVPVQAILVRTGAFDKIGAVLTAYGIPHKVVNEDRKLKHLRATQVLLVDGDAKKPEPFLANDLANDLAKFVDRGGWLVTADWSALYLERKRPGQTRVFRIPDGVELLDKTSRQELKLLVTSVADLPLLKGVIGKKEKLEFYVDDSPHLFRITGGRDVERLLTSPTLKPFGTTDVAFAYRHGKGRGLHCLVSFEQEGGSEEGRRAMQRLLLNFLLERFRKE